MKSFSSRIIDWHQRHGRHTLPWQASRDPYHIWLSEIMLQQTQVSTAIPYFERFLKALPDLAALAAASEDQVLALWSGLGYYSRAHNLHAAARVIAEKYGGRFPASAELIATLPGVGRSTAGAVAALAFGQRCAILDGNVKRVLSRHGGIAGWPGERAVETALWQLAEARLPSADIDSYTQGMMDLGALLCTRAGPDCAACPVRGDCVARTTGRVAELPTPRPRKPLPEKHVQMLMLFDRGELMLEKRPARGIWGGLWSLPEVPVDDDPVEHCRTRFGYAADLQYTLPPLSHTFTHFKLHIQPVRLTIAARNTTLPGHLWLSPVDALSAALPAPARKLVAQLAE